MSSSSSIKTTKDSDLKALVVSQLSKNSNKEGSKIRFDAIAIRSVIDTNSPSATVPPNSDACEYPKTKKQDD